MSLKQEIETWVSALAHYDNNEFDEALKEFDAISDTSKILFNVGVIHATLGEHEKAVECYQRAVRLDQYLAVAYFQQGVSNFLVGDFEEALANFNDTLLYLRGNNIIDYAQLGLMFKLYSCEVLFNRGLCYIYLQQKEAGMQDFSYAVKEKVVEDHNVIDEAIKEEAQGYTVFSIPVGVVYRPNQAKVKNLKTKDYLGKARLVAATDRNNAFTGFAGTEIKKIGLSENDRDDRSADNLSFAATNLVKPGLTSKRQQSEPPLNRNVFPPTPPPENEKPPELTRGQSVRAGTKPAPARLNIEKARQPQRYEIREDPALQRERERLGTQRTSSEPRGPTRQYSTSGRDRDRDRDSSRTRRPTAPPREPEDYAGDVYDMYSTQRNSRGSRSNGRSRTQQSQYDIEEEDGSEYDDDPYDDNDFEMMNRPAPRALAARQPSLSSQRRPGSKRSAPEIRMVRVKVHAESDVRYVMVGTAIEFPDFVEKIREKFGLRRRFKLKVKDDDGGGSGGGVGGGAAGGSVDMITVGDQDDLEMILMTVKSHAVRERADMGRLEIWVQDI